MEVPYHQPKRHGPQIIGRINGLFAWNLPQSLNDTQLTAHRGKVLQEKAPTLLSYVSKKDNLWKSTKKSLPRGRA